MIVLSILRVLCFASRLYTCYAEEPWSFIVLADPHNAETFASKDENHEWYKNAFSQNVQGLKHIKETYGGDLVLIPGDTNSGKWYLPSFAEKLGDPSLTPIEAVLRASKGCYGSLRKVFAAASYVQTPMVAIGDHELGGNGWEETSTKTAVLEYYRDGFQKELNRNESGDFMYSEPIGNADSRPIGTIHENTSYARKYKNVLFVTIDCFHSKGYNFEDREAGLGGEGSVTVSVEGKHLTWFEEVLKESQNDEMIKHIIVQAHVPILQPLRKVDSSGQFFDHGSESLFWKTMVKYGVDLYLTGEVHATTAAKDANSPLLQIASRGNQLNNFVSVEIGDDSINIKAFNEVGTKPKGNNNYTQFGEISVDKSLNGTMIESHGILELLDVDAPLIRFDFEDIVQMSTHQVIGLKNKQQLILSEVNIRGISCTESMKNKGVFGQQYNAQVANIDLVQGRRGMSAGKFTSASRFAIYSGGPHGGGNMMSYNVWIKTVQDEEMVLVHYGKVWGDVASPLSTKDFHMLTLDKGNPTLYIGTNAKLVPLQPLELHDDAWHHLSVSMPERSCLLSEVTMYIDGKMVSVYTPQDAQDRHIFHFSGGKLSLGGFGYSSNYEKAFPSVQPYTGLMDDFLLFGRPVSSKELEWMTAPNYDIRYGTSCIRTQQVNTEPIKITTGLKKCKRKCAKHGWCKGYEFSKFSDEKKCTLFKQPPEFGESKPNTRCALMLS